MSLFPNRECFHKYMGPGEEFPCCDGRGWYYKVIDEGTEDDRKDPFFVPDYREAYCDCEAGKERRRVEVNV